MERERKRYGGQTDRQAGMQAGKHTYRQRRGERERERELRMAI